jgi:hypothetical protein
MSYGLRGRGGRISGLGVFNPVGLGFDYYDLLKSAGGTQVCDPRDSACVAQNEQITDAVRALWTSQYMTNPDVANQPVPDVSVNLQTSPAALQQYMQNIPVTSETISVDQGPVKTAAQWLSGGSGGASAAVTPVRRGGQLTFTTSKGTAALQVGDTWLVAISGASPNSPVTVSGSGPGGAFSNTPMGSTDGSGNFSKSGSVGTAEIGSWSEQWAVGGAPSGAFSFTVAAVPTSPVIFKSGTTDGSTPGGAAASGGSTVGGFDLSSIPWWGWALGAGAALFMFGGGRGR